MKKLNFEKLAEEFATHFRTRSLSHCDFVELGKEEVTFFEESVYVNKRIFISQS